MFLLANGASGVTIDAATLPRFVHALREVCLELALGIVRGGEGATKLVTVSVTGAVTDDDARQTARAIANSPLVKTAIHGGDPNWGRLVAVAGRAGGRFELDGARVLVGDVVLFEHGRPFDERAPLAAEYLQGNDVTVTVDMGTGGPARGPHVHLRPERGLRQDQRGVSDVATREPDRLYSTNMLKGSREVIVQHIQPVSVHGQISLDVVYVAPDAPDGQKYIARLGPEDVAKNLEAGDRILVHFLLGIATAVTRE